MTDQDVAKWVASGRFNGSSDYLSITDPTDTDWNFGTDPFTIEFWINYTTSANFYALDFYLDGNNNVRFDFEDSGYTCWVFWNSTGATDVKTTAVLNDGAWHHIAFTRSGNTFRLFTDGTLRDTETYSSAINLANAGTDLFVGCATGPSTYMPGYLDDLRITKGLARYTANFTPSTVSLLPRATYGTTSSSSSP